MQYKCSIVLYQVILKAMYRVLLNIELLIWNFKKSPL